MSSIPTQNRRKYYSGSRDRSSRLATSSVDDIGKQPGSRVRFNTHLAAKKPFSLSQTERERRKHEALDFLRKETANTGYSRRSRTSLGSENHFEPKTSSRTNPANLKTYELLGEQPINRIPTVSSRSILYDNEAIRNITRESRKRDPLGFRSTGGITDNFSKVRKPQASYNSKNHSILNSLSNFGSRVLRSVLYNEENTDLKTVGDVTPSVTQLQKGQAERLESELKQKELDLQLAERTRYLNELNRQIQMREQENHSNSTDFVDQSKSIDKQIGKLDERLQSILEEVNASSNGKLLEELGRIKEELTSLRRKQESNNLNFQSQFEDMKLENYKNRQKFDKLFKELEEKRKELDLEKNGLIELLQNHKSPFTNPSLDESTILKTLSNKADSYNAVEYKNTNDKGDYNSSTASDPIYQFDSEEDNSTNSDNEEVRDILRYILKHKRNHKLSNSKVKSRVRQIRNNLQKIEQTTNKKEKN